MASKTPPEPARAAFELELMPSRQFPDWLAEVGASLAWTTYQGGRLFLVGLDERGRLSIFNRALARCMGLGVDERGMFVSSLYQIHRFENALKDGQHHGQYDRVFIPQVSHITGDVDVHDIGIGADGKPIFVNTLFSCLATTSDRYSFEPVWRPPFISRLAAEDRCHLNGLAMRDQRPAHVTAVSRSDVADGWRERRRDGGIVMDVASGDVVLDGLSMPHSPRHHNGELWLHNSGEGFFGRADLTAGRFEPVAFCPGYLRGLTFIGHYAVAGISKPRHNKTFSGLALDDNLAARDAEARCSLLVIDLRTGDIAHWLRIEGSITELYDIAVLPGVRCPMALGFKSDEIRRFLSLPPES